VVLKKLLLVTHAHKPLIGGSTVVYDALAKYVNKIEVHIMAARHSVDDGTLIPNAEAFDNSAPYPVHRVEAFRTPDTGHNLSRLQRHKTVVGMSIKAFAHISQLHEQHKFAAICVGNLNSLSWIGSAMKLRYGLPYCHYVHGEELTMEMHSGFYDWKRRRNLLRSGRIYTASQFALDSLAAFPGLPMDRAFLVGNGVDEQAYAADNSLLAASAVRRPFTIICIGRQVRRKGFDNAIRAFSLAREQIPDAKLVLVGHGPEHENLVNLRNELGLQECVSLLGTVSQEILLKNLHNSDLFLMPNRTLDDGDTEGFGLVFLEANAAGKPVIGGKAGGAVGAIKDGETGFLVDPLDVPLIAQKIVSLAKDRQLYLRLSTQGLLHAQSYSWRNIATRFEDDVLSWLQRTNA
jgi:phosphatidyl-myo-inositol dimannoside synthase